MVPNHGGGTEAQRPASLLQPPAHVHVVSGDAEPWVEPADRLETRFTERHVAAGDVLRLAIGEEDVHRPARRARHALGDRAVAGRGEDRKSTRLNSSHGYISYAVFCLKKKKQKSKIY